MSYGVPKKPIKPIYHVLTFFTWAGLAVWYFAGSSGAVTPPKTAEAAAQQPVAKPDVELIDFNWWKTTEVTFDASFKIRNNSDVPIKDIEMRCDASAPSGTRIDSNVRTIYEVVKPHTTRTFPRFSMGLLHSQAVREGCGITDWQK